MEVSKSDNYEEAQAQVDIWKYALGFTEMAVVKCAIDLGIPDILENHSGSMTLAELLSALGCSSPSDLHRIMTFLTHHGIFKEVKADDQQGSLIAYAQTPLSRLLMMKNGFGPMVQFFTNPVSIASLSGLSKFLTLGNGECSNSFEATHGVDIWKYFAANSDYRKMFNNAMSSHASYNISMVIEKYKSMFEGITSLVDVGGGDGTASRALVKACPWITRAINFDLPHVVSKFSSDGGDDRVEHIGGDMFVAVPSADAALIMSVLQDWDDEACVKILKKCRKAIPMETGKVIIVSGVVDEGNNEYRGVQLTIDMVMLANTVKGKQRTMKEWINVLNDAGFTKHTVKHIPAPSSVIQAYP